MIMPEHSLDPPQGACHIRRLARPRRRSRVACARCDGPESDKAMNLPLMPKATAVWLIEKTALTFTQIADLCGMHPLEVQAIADGEVAQGIVGYDPVANGQLTMDEIHRCEADPNARL